MYYDDEMVIDIIHYLLLVSVDHPHPPFSSFFLLLHYLLLYLHHYTQFSEAHRVVLTTGDALYRSVSLSVFCRLPTGTIEKVSTRVVVVVVVVVAQPDCLPTLVRMSAQAERSRSRTAQRLRRLFTT